MFNKIEQNNTLILIDKPKGITSFDVIRKLRKKLSVRKMGHALKPKLGHAGTLDPLATGLLIVGVGDGTKQLKDIVGLSKEYEAEILLGVRTDTGDIDGRILEEKEISMINHTNLEDVLNGMVGILELQVPIYSAIKRGGEALYKKARRGEMVEPPLKKMEIFEIEFLDAFPCENHFAVKIRMKVSSGTYVRSLAEEIGRRLGVPACVRQLRRTKVGEYSVKDAQSIE